MRGGPLFFLLLICSVVLTGCVAFRGPTLTERMAKAESLYEHAQQAMAPVGGKKPDYKAAADYYEEAARQGSAKAAYALAALYRDRANAGYKPEEMREKSFFWMLDAAHGGWPQAQYEVAVKFAQGAGTEEDNREALEWLEKAANNNHPLAQRFLGMLYLNGSMKDSAVKVKPDAVKAAQWFLKAARNDDGPSQAAIGNMYMTGKGVRKDLYEARKWNALAAKKGDAGAQRRMVTLSRALEEEKASGEAKNILDLRSAYRRGDAQAGSNLGRLYYYAPAPNNNVSRALELFKATAGKVPASALMLGVAAEEGKGVKQNFAEAVDWYKKASEAGLVEANAYLASAYLEGRGVPANQTEAVRLLLDGAAKADARCQSRLSQLYSLGKGVDRDYEKALTLAKHAAESGDALAMNMLATMYEKGVGTARDLDAAKHWFGQLAEYNPSDYDFVRIEPYSAMKRSAKAGVQRLEKIK